MASARCVYCNATLIPNSAYCVECGQLIQQGAAAAPAPAAPVAQAPAAVKPAGARAGSGVPLPRSLPWQAAAPQAPPTSTPTPEVPVVEKVLESVELQFDSGERLRVTGKAVLGRQPADTAHTMGARPVAVADTTRSVSRVHLFLNVENGQLTVADAGSANGSRLERDRRVVQLEGGGQPVAARVGDVVWLGDVRVAIRA